ncbi:MAG: very short patch repair endonuclease [Sideroxyarcus sp.]|nr:very short patch repair endonuclease [Sideroxyarcus sp.]
MVDHVSKEKRSEIMKRIRGKDTTPELVVRKLIHSMGYRYRLNVRGLPGRPDIVFANRKKVIFIHGCFWHRHGCKKGKPPKSNLEYWLPKLKDNQTRDVRNQRHLASLGWKTLVIWQCETKDTNGLKKIIAKFLGRNSRIHA